MPWTAQLSFAFMLLLAVSSAQAQSEDPTRIWRVEEKAESITVAHASDEREDALRFIWDRAADQGYAFIAVARNESFPPASLVSVIKTALGAYLDVQVKFGKDGVLSEFEASEQISEMESMVNVLLESTSLAPAEFKFSSETEQALAKLCRIDWSNTSYALEGNPEEEKYLAIYKFVRVQRKALERSIENDLNQYNGLRVSAENVTIGNYSDATICGTVFDQEKYLCALDLKVNEVYAVDPGPGLAFSLVDDPPAIIQESGNKLEVNDASSAKQEELVATTKVRKRDRWLQEELARLNVRMDKLDNSKEVFAIRDRIDEIENRLNEIEGEIEEIRSSNQTSNLVEQPKIFAAATIVFRSGSVIVSADQELQLRTIQEQLKRRPELGLVITGYSDKSGNASANMRLSEKRAKAVRDHFIRNGIPGERLMVNYLGDTKSAGVNPSERRVEIEWMYR